jgi:hypothetical protein
MYTVLKKVGGGKDYIHLETLRGYCSIDIMQLQIFALLALLVESAHAFLPVRSIASRSIASTNLHLPRKSSLNAATGVEPEKFTFESNVSRVMDIIIHSLYSNKDVFLRELVRF